MGSREKNSMAKARPGAVLGAVSGALGDEVAARTRGGMALRGKPKYSYPKSVNQEAGAERLVEAMQVWNTLDRDTFLRWNAYAETLTRTDPLTGEAYHPTGQNVFVGLANKFRQAVPDAPIPTLPPDAAYRPDALQMQVTGLPGRLRFAANAANTEPNVTEILVQPLKSPRRTPGAFYKSAGFVLFQSANLNFILEVPPGWYACACRFVNYKTGQMTALQTLGVVQVTD